MTNVELIDRIILQGRALVRAIEALGTIQPSGPFERALARLPMAAYKRRLRGVVAVARLWVVEEILNSMPQEAPEADSLYSDVMRRINSESSSRLGYLSK
jgi:hypothetical protein